MDFETRIFALSAAAPEHAECRRGPRYRDGRRAVKLTPDAVIALCADFAEVYPVNFNCPGQITVSAAAEQMP